MSNYKETVNAVNDNWVCVCHLYPQFIDAHHGHVITGDINIIGNPNVGKSTLMNRLIGQKLSIITHKAQTTRHRILGILNEKEYQIVFSDTPGVIEPAYKLQENMMNLVYSAFQDADILIYMIEIGEKGLKDEKLFERLKTSSVPVLILLNQYLTLRMNYHLL